MNKLIEEFEIDKKSTEKSISDYEIFKNKEKLEKYRLAIIEKLIDNGQNIEQINKSTIINVTDDITFGDDLTNEEKNYLYNVIYEEINGFGPLTSLLNDDNITEIMVNSPNEIYIETDGSIKKDDSVSFINNDHIYRIINKLLSKQMQHVDIDNPMCETRLEDGSRINVVVPPLTSNPTITISKRKNSVDNIESLIGDGALTVEMANFIDRAVQSKKNILISGNIGSGKTTLLNAIGDLIPNEERIIAVEDISELEIKNHHVVKLEAKHCEGNDITTNQLLKTAIKLNPERIILGEIKGTEALTFVEMLNSGYIGSIATIYADSCEDAIKKVELLSSLSNKDYPIEVIKELIVNNIDIIIHISKMKNGHRKITAISTFDRDKNNNFIINNLYEFNIIELDDKEIKGEYKKNNQKVKAMEKEFI